MGKLLNDSTTAVEILSPSPLPPLPPLPPLSSLQWPGPTAILTQEAADLTYAAEAAAAWAAVSGLEEQQRRRMERIHAHGVFWKNPRDAEATGVAFRLEHGGDVEADGNCLFTAARRVLGPKAPSARELRQRGVRRFLEDYQAGDGAAREAADGAIRNLYSPDLKAGWGIHVVQELKLLARKEARENLDASIQELVDLGMKREVAAESIYKERCITINDGLSWAKYMLISGSPEDEYDIINLQYTEEGLLTIDENCGGHAAAFGDDIAIESLATEFRREVFVVQAHGTDAMVDENNCVFFLPHCPRGPICEPPIFLFMKGTGWCGAGADHYEPLIASPLPLISQDKAALVL